MGKRIVLYRTDYCERCVKAADVLGEVLEQLGYDFDEEVEVRYVKNLESVEELRGMNILSAPTIRIGDHFLVEDEPTDENIVWQFLIEEGYKRRSP